VRIEFIGQQKILNVKNEIMAVGRLVKPGVKEVFPGKAEGRRFKRGVLSC
jgi:hypothetical protein